MLEKAMAEITHDSRTTNVMAEILSRLDRLEKENSRLKQEVSALNKYADFCNEKIYNLEKQTSHI